MRGLSKSSQWGICPFVTKYTWRIQGACFSSERKEYRSSLKQKTKIALATLPAKLSINKPRAQKCLLPYPRTLMGHSDQNGF